MCITRKYISEVVFGKIGLQSVMFMYVIKIEVDVHTTFGPIKTFVVEKITIFKTWRKLCGIQSMLRRVEWFLKKNWEHAMLYCSTLFWDPKSKILLWSVAFSPRACMASQGLRKPLKSLKRPKISENRFLFKNFKSFTWNKKVSLFYLKAKNEEKLENKICLLFFR